MSRRSLAAFVIVLAIGVPAAPAAGQNQRRRRRFRMDRAPHDGTPDLQGFWTTQQPVAKSGISEIDTTALLFYTGGHGDGHDT